MNALKVYVVDASVVLKWALPEPGRVRAAALLDDYEAQRAHLLSPPTLMHEVASGLAKRFRQKHLNEQEAASAFAFIRDRLPLTAGTGRLAETAFDFALQHHVSYWDALYLALAIEYRCDLVTADTRFQRIASKLYPYVVALGS